MSFVCKPFIEVGQVYLDLVAEPLKSSANMSEKDTRNLENNDLCTTFAALDIIGWMSHSWRLILELICLNQMILKVNCLDNVNVYIRTYLYI